MSRISVSDKVTVTDSPEVPQEWRGVNAIVMGVDYVTEDSGEIQKTVTVENQNNKRLDLPLNLLRPRGD